MPSGNSGDNLQRGGDIFDPVGTELVAKFARTAYKDSEVAAIAQRHDISLNDVCIIYASMIKSLMPNPCIKSGGLLPVPTLFFMEPIRFEGLASEIATRTRGTAADERQRKLIDLSISGARQTWQTHTAARGEAEFKITGSGGRRSAGCAGVVVIGLLLGGGLAGGLMCLLTVRTSTRAALLGRLRPSWHAPAGGHLARGRRQEPAAKFGKTGWRSLIWRAQRWPTDSATGDERQCPEIDTRR